jgi:hypothetical protein
MVTDAAHDFIHRLNEQEEMEMLATKGVEAGAAEVQHVEQPKTI